jgi:hypothetical protein
MGMADDALLDDSLTDDGPTWCGCDVLEERLKDADENAQK